MGRFTRLLVPRASVLCGLVALVVVLQALALLRPSRWRSPVLAATSDGFLLGWIDGDHPVGPPWLAVYPIRAQALDRELAPLSTRREVGQGPETARLSLWTRREQLRLISAEDGSSPVQVLETFDGHGRAIPQDEPPEVWPIDAQLTVGGYRVTLQDPAREWFPVSGGWSRDGAAVAMEALDRTGALRATVERSRGGWRIESAAGSDPWVTSLADGLCPPLAPYGCVAAAADEDGVAVVWTRDHALGAELVVSHVGGAGADRHEVVLDREQHPSRIAAFSALLSILLGLFAHAASRTWGALRVLRSLRRARAPVWLDGRLDEPHADLVVDGDARSWRMRTGAAWLNVASGDRVLLQPGRPFVVTMAALQGELPAHTASVASFDRAYAAGAVASADALGAYRGGGTSALRVAVLSDAPLPLVRHTLRVTLACAVVDMAALVGIAALALAGSF